MVDLNSLNNNQQKAVTAPMGPVIVVAGAGTGKTKVLTTRIIYLIENNNFPAHKILAITFTNKAANEMKNRIFNSINKNYSPWIGTYHSICLRILKEDINLLGRDKNFSVIDDEDQISLIREIYRFKQIIPKSIKPQKMISLISKIKSGKINIQNKEFMLSWLKEFGIYTYGEYDDVKKCFISYEQKLLTNNLLDYDDLILLVETLLSENDEAKRKWQNRFDYILVDEFQDTNLTQFNILNMLVNKNNNVLVVGDPDQSIYKWRGAFNNIFKKFKIMYPAALTVILDTNYRSTKNILNGSNNLIKNNDDRIEKSLITQNNEGEKIFFYCGETQSDEGLFIAKKIIELHKNGYQYSEFSVLYRSNYLSRFIEEYLMSNNIPYYIYGGIKFYQRKEIKDLISYLKLLVSNDEVSLKRVINTPRRNIGLTSIEKITEYAEKNNISFFDALNLENVPWNNLKPKSFHKLILSLREETKKMTISQSLKYVIEKISYKEWLKSFDLESKIENVDELVRTIEFFEKEQKIENPTIVDYLQEISLYTEKNENLGVNKFNQDAVSLMTVHVSKGSEYKIIFIAGFNDSIFPSTKSFDYEEERRIAYVAMTRAKEKLFITCSKGYSYTCGNNMTPSRFVKEIGKENIEELTNQYVNISTADLSWYNSKKNINYENEYETKEINFNIGDMVVHTFFGSGIITGISGDILTIVFKSPHGIKSIMKNHKSIKRVKN